MFSTSKENIASLRDYLSISIGMGILRSGLRCSMLSIFPIENWHGSGRQPILPHQSLFFQTIAIARGADHRQVGQPGNLLPQPVNMGFQRMGGQAGLIAPHF